MKNNHKVCLVILDGWGKGREDESNAIYLAKTPFTKYLSTAYPHALLRTDGENVGLPEGQMGNSEVGHTNIGAGRIVYQDLVKINIAIREGSFFLNQTLLNAMSEAKRRNSKVHLIGLVSDGGVHSHSTHLKALCDLTTNFGLQDVYVHAFTDGRDTDPKSGIQFIRELEKHIENSPVKIASVIGRYYAMDRDKRWERVKKAYDLLVHGVGKKYNSASEAIESSYNEGITDEFIEPCIIAGNTDQSPVVIENNDVVICFNYRTDRCREITEVLTQKEFSEYEMSPLQLYYLTMTNYDESFKNVHVVYDKDNLSMTLGEVLEQNHKTQVRIAETEKYPHVTFFFSGGREKPFNLESRIMAASPKVATYDLMPEMSAQEVADKICESIKSETPDFICLNFANPDMVGHTGVVSAVIKAVETTDRCLKQVVEAGLEKGYSFIIIADHGNADYIKNEDGSPNTAHTTNPVPVWIINEAVSKVHNGILADVAPTVLKLMGLNQPAEMTGKPLFD